MQQQHQKSNPRNHNASLRVAFLSLVAALILAIVLIGGAASTSAQDVIVPTDTPPGPISVSGIEPVQVTNTGANTVSIFGNNFASTTVVRLVGVGILQSSLLNSTVITATIPENLNPGLYTIQLSDPQRGTVNVPTLLQVFAIPPTSPPLATFEPRTPPPGQPSLIIRNFTAEPAEVVPGTEVVLAFEIVNVGNRPAEGISVALGTDSNFAPAIGQSSITLPTINPGGVFEVSLSVIAAQDAPAGINSIPISFAYRDFLGETYTTTNNVSVTVIPLQETSQVTVSSYNVEPSPVVPGELVTLNITVTNSGNAVANRVLLRVAGDSSVLLAGAQGDSFPLGDIPAGESIDLEIPMIVAQDSDPGPQAQPITLSFQRGTESQELTSRITVNVASPTSALLLLQSYSTGDELLEPGDRFTLTFNLANVGDAPAPDSLITFGTVSSSNTDGGSGTDGGTTGGSGTGGTTTDPIPGNAFAPLGSGNTVFVGTIDAGDSLEINQEFIINGTVRSGIYNLPITVRHRRADGTIAQDNLQASVVVVAPPQLQTRLSSPLPPIVNVGEPVSLPLEIINNGTSTVNLTRLVVDAENVEFLDGSTRELEPVRADDDFTVDVPIMAQEEGDVTITMTIFYRDDLNGEQSIVLNFDTDAVMPPPLPEFTPPPDSGAEVTPEPELDLFGRLLLGFLGIGG
jgi:hypothetical protein